MTRIDRGDLTPQEWVRREQAGRFAASMSGYGGPIIADGSLWIMSPGSTSSLVEIDLAEPAIRAENPAADGWSTSDDRNLWMGAIGDAIWLSSRDPDRPGRRLTRFDLDTRQYTDVIDDLPFDSYQGFAGCCVVGDDAIWFIDARTVSRFDIGTLAVTDTLEVGTDLQGAVATPGAIWVVDQADGERWGGGGGTNGAVVRIDTSTRDVTDVIEVGAAPEPPALLHGAVWVANHSDSSLSRIDVDARQVTDTVAVPVHPHEPLASDGVVWVYTQNGEMARIALDGAGRPTGAQEVAPPE